MPIILACVLTGAFWGGLAAFIIGWPVGLTVPAGIVIMFGLMGIRMML